MFCGQASAQDKTVRVCVLDARNANNLAGATVKVTTSESTISSVTGNEGCAYLTGQIPVSIEEETVGGLGLSAGAPYPNPASNWIAIPVYSAQLSSENFSLYDVQGRLMSIPVRKLMNAGGQLFEVDLSSLTDGVYFYRIVGAKGVTSGKFVKNRGAVQSRTGLMQHGLLSSGRKRGKLDMPVPYSNPVTIEVGRDGYSAILDERSLRNFETVTYSLFKITEDLIPLIDMYGVKYLGHFEGGLYPDQQNEMPAHHFEAGLSKATSIEPLDTSGNPDVNGRIIMTSIGMSTTSSIFCGVADPAEPCKEGTFMDAILEETGINPQLVVIDGADPGKTADEWEDPSLRAFDRVNDEELVPIGLSEQQVQVAWVNLASSQPVRTLPDLESDAFQLEKQYGNALRALDSRYPNLKMVFFASRVYAGYAVTDLNPEPYAYESGFAVKWAIEAQIKQMEAAGAPVDAEAGDLNYETVAPWAAWGPYLWADGDRPRSDGLVWLPEDLKEDGTHLNRPGIEKITAILLDFFESSPLSRCWFLEAGGACE